MTVDCYITDADLSPKKNVSPPPPILITSTTESLVYTIFADQICSETLILAMAPGK